MKNAQHHAFITCTAPQQQQNQVVPPVISIECVIKLMLHPTANLKCVCLRHIANYFQCRIAKSPSSRHVLTDAAELKCGVYATNHKSGTHCYDGTASRNVPCRKRQTPVHMAGHMGSKSYMYSEPNLVIPLIT